MFDTNHSPDKKIFIWSRLKNQTSPLLHVYTSAVKPPMNDHTELTELWPCCGGSDVTTEGGMVGQQLCQALLAASYGRNLVSLRKGPSSVLFLIESHPVLSIARGYLTFKLNENFSCHHTSRVSSTQSPRVMSSPILDLKYKTLACVDKWLFATLLLNILLQTNDYLGFYNVKKH